MATIAADAGVGIGTLYRHFATRNDLLSYLTHVSFERVLANARTQAGTARRKRLTTQQDRQAGKPSPYQKPRQCKPA